MTADTARAPEFVACVTECEACFTPDVCQLRGTCDHYAASQLRVAAAIAAANSADPRERMDLAQWVDGPNV